MNKNFILLLFLFISVLSYNKTYVQVNEMNRPSDSGKEISKTFQEFFEATQRKDAKKIAEYLHPKLFEFVSKEELIEGMEKVNSDTTTILTTFVNAQSQSDISLSFVPVLGDKSLLAEGEAPNENLEIETLQFYISNIKLYSKDTVVFQEENSYHLLDLEDPTSLKINLNVADDLQFSHLIFSLGIDSLTNVSGAFGGDLDPTNGMYWTWQSGYINFKLEGIASECPARNNRFQFHIGGYQSPFNTLQQVTLKISDKKEIKIKLAINKIFEEINLEKNFQIMSPNQEAIEFSRLLSTIFSVSK